jgi:hypothetical protein
MRLTEYLTPPRCRGRLQHGGGGRPDRRCVVAGTAATYARLPPAMRQAVDEFARHQGPGCRSVAAHGAGVRRRHRVLAGPCVTYGTQGT